MVKRACTRCGAEAVEGFQMCQRCLDRHNEVYKTGIVKEGEEFGKPKKAGSGALFKILLIPIIISGLAIIIQLGKPQTTASNANQPISANPPVNTDQTKPAGLVITDKSIKTSWEGKILVIEGLIENTTKNAYSFVSISFNMLDMDGNVIDVISDSISGLKAGGTWKFRVLGTDYDRLKNGGKLEVFKLEGY